jgi:hypothetical protein
MRCTDFDGGGQSVFCAVINKNSSIEVVNLICIGANFHPKLEI